MTEERRALFKRIMWDYTYTPQEVEAIVQSVGLGKEKIMIYRKILMSERWYNIIKILSSEELKEALQEEVLKTIWIESLRKLYRNARRILYGEDQFIPA